MRDPPEEEPLDDPEELRLPLLLPELMDPELRLPEELEDDPDDVDVLRSRGREGAVFAGRASLPPPEFDGRLISEFPLLGFSAGRLVVFPFDELGGAGTVHVSRVVDEPEVCAGSLTFCVGAVLPLEFSERFSGALLFDTGTFVVRMVLDDSLVFGRLTTASFIAALVRSVLYSAATALVNISEKVDPPLPAGRPSEAIGVSRGP